MQQLTDLGNAAKGLAKNPLGIIALFIVMIYGFAALTLGASTHLVEAERQPLVWFLVAFPVLVLVTFGWLVSCHHEKLYAPGDFKTDDSFLRGLAKSKHTAEVQEIQSQLKTKINEAVTEVANQGSGGNVPIDPEQLKRVIEKISEQIDSATTITVDASKFLKDDHAVYTFPVAAFSTLSDLTDEVYFKLSPKVRAFHYGYSWVLRDACTGETVKNIRMLSDAEPGVPLSDKRTLSEVGIRPGTTLTVEKPNRT